MENYNINENRPELTQEQLEAGMDFSKVKQIAAKNAPSSFYKKLGLGLGVLIIALTSFFLLNSVEKKTEESSVSLLKTEANQLQSFTIYGSMDTTLLFNTGSLIKVPSNAFVDAGGNPVSGLIELKYREFHNVGEIILAGIPMTYDSAGAEYHFESAGMFELNAFQNGEPVFLAKDKIIEVSLASLDKNENKFNQYYLDPASKKWSYTGEDKPRIVSLPDSVGTTDSAKSGLDLIKPIAKKKSRQQFTVGISYDDYPELKAFDNVLFEVSPETKNFDPTTAKMKWDDVTVDRIGKSDNYKLTFIGSGKTVEVIAYPVVEKNDLKKSQATFDQLYANYKMKTSVRENLDKNKERKLQGDLSVSQKAVNYFKALAQAKENQRIAENVSATEEIIYRTFQVKNFGIWNSDCPASMPQEAIVKAKYVDETGQEVKIAVVYMVETGKNALYTLYDGKKVYFNPENDNTLIVMTKDNSMGIFTKDQFKYLDKDTKEFTFKLKIVKKEFYMPADFLDII